MTLQTERKPPQSELGQQPCQRLSGDHPDYRHTNGQYLLGLLYISGSAHSTCQVCKQFTEAGFMADVDLDSGCLLNKKIRNAQLGQYNFILGEITLLFPWL